MTVEAIRLENFMAFEDTGWIELRPICLLFGRNSSGKSAIIRALRLLKQSLDCSPDGDRLVFTAEEGLDQGSFKETVHRQEFEQREMVFRFRCRLPILSEEWEDVSKWLKSIPKLTELINEANNLVELSLGFGWDEKAKRTELTRVSIDCPVAKSDTREPRTIFTAEKLPEEVHNAIGYPWWFGSDFLLGHLYYGIRHNTRRLKDSEIRDYGS